MALWIEFHPDELLDSQKFQDFRAQLRWSENEALGFLGRFWGKVLKLREAGDISGWRPDFIARLTGVSLPPDSLWKPLSRFWLDVRGEAVLVHDWLEYAGPFLRGKYKTRNVDRLKEIWSLHGKVYGEGSSREVAGKVLLRSPYRPDLTDQTLPNRTSGSERPGKKCAWNDGGDRCGRDAEFKAHMCRDHILKAQELKAHDRRDGGWR